MPPLLFSAKSCWGIPRISLSPKKNTHTQLKYYLSYWLSNDEVSTMNTDSPHQWWTCQTSRKRPASSSLNAKACQPTASVGSISPTCAWPPPPTDNEVMLYRKGGHNCERNCCIPPISPPAFCTKAKVAKGGGGDFAGHYGIYGILINTCN